MPEDPLSAEERALLSEEISNEPISHPPDPATSAPSTARATGAPMAPNAPTGLVTPPAILANATVHAEPNEPELEVIERPDTECLGRHGPLRREKGETKGGVC